jgi:hypothetical protein
VLYTADAQPVVALVGTRAMWRDLKVGVADGADVTVLERNLADLGYDVSADDHFGATTADAVRQWEEDLGRSDPDGTVEPGDVVTVSAPTDVTEQLGQVGESISAGQTLLTLSTTAQVVSAEVDAEDARAWRAGSSVTLQWTDRTTSTGRIAGSDRAEADGAVGVTITGGGSLAAQASGASVDVTLTRQRKTRVLAVPVGAITAGEDGRSPAVQVVTGSQRGLVQVTTGLTSGGWVEISGPVRVGDEVAVPG